ncbi:DUF6169 family protein [Spirosoma montaniterrae]|uniref:Uncharacterized protein n=1 Tax=Spirosoma montaniterrae TaxID=1178516 RepID=A0A1P9X185_9BACT|nr:DUF6169 family protein [Spirosoma montaniterrae]AQG81384.1 hypothetical protein AWR27_19900 [Spirosoma montaniterrae]
MLIPYALQENADGSISFTTCHAVRYTTEFRDASHHFDDEFVKNAGVAEFSFGPDEGYTPGPYDPRVELTLIYLAQTYFVNSGDLLLYVCESLDGRHKARHRVFARWFNQYASGQYDKIDFELTDAETSMLVSVVLPTRHPYRLHYQNVLEETFDFYTGLK